jgi:hypothetical protein
VGQLRIAPAALRVAHQEGRLRSLARSLITTTRRERARSRKGRESPCVSRARALRTGATQPGTSRVARRLGHVSRSGARIPPLTLRADEPGGARRDLPPRHGVAWFSGHAAW